MVVLIGAGLLVVVCLLCDDVLVVCLMCDDVLVVDATALTVDEDLRLQSGESTVAMTSMAKSVVRIVMIESFIMNDYGWNN